MQVLSILIVTGLSHISRHIWRRSRKITQALNTPHATNLTWCVRFESACECVREGERYKRKRDGEGDRRERERGKKRERKRKVPSIFANITMSYVLSLYLVFSIFFQIITFFLPLLMLDSRSPIMTSRQFYYFWPPLTL